MPAVINTVRLTFKQLQTGTTSSTDVAHLLLSLVLGTTCRCITATCNSGIQPRYLSVLGCKVKLFWCKEQFWPDRLPDVTGDLFWWLKPTITGWSHHGDTAGWHVQLSLHFIGHFPGVSGLAGIRMSILDLTGAKDDGHGGDNWSYKMCKAPVKSSPTTYQQSSFYRRMLFQQCPLMPNQQCQSKHWSETCTTQLPYSLLFKQEHYVMHCILLTHFSFFLVFVIMQPTLQWSLSVRLRPPEILLEETSVLLEPDVQWVWRPDALSTISIKSSIFIVTVNMFILYITYHLSLH